MYNKKLMNEKMEYSYLIQKQVGKEEERNRLDGINRKK